MDNIPVINQNYIKEYRPSPPGDILHYGGG